jgi:hypothetical protein
MGILILILRLLLEIIHGGENVPDTGRPKAGLKPCATSTDRGRAKALRYEYSVRL